MLEHFQLIPSVFTVSDSKEESCFRIHRGMHATSICLLLKQVHFFWYCPAVDDHVILWTDAAALKNCRKVVCLHTCLFWSTLLYLCRKCPAPVSIASKNHLFSIWLNYNGAQWVLEIMVVPAFLWSSDCYLSTL